MARKRMIDPHIWEDPSFNSLSRDARLLFIGMISNADDDGYLRGDAGSMKRLIFGFDDMSKEEVSPLLEEMTGFDNLHFFEIDNEVFVHFIKWNEYQKQREDRMQPSVYPKCTSCTHDSVETSDACQTDDGQLPAEVKLSKEKLEEVNIIADEQQLPEKSKEPKKENPYIRLEVENQQPIHRLCYLIEDLLSTKIVTWGKQAKALGMMTKAGYTEKQIEYVIRKMRTDEFYQDKGFDLMTVANVIDKFKARDVAKEKTYEKARFE